MKRRQCTISYGNNELSLYIPDHGTELSLREPLKVVSPAGFRQNIRHFVDTEKPDLSKVALVVADKTRLCGYPQYLPILLEELENGGMNRNRLKIIIAYGTHPRQSDEECLQAYGETYNNYNFTHHDCTTGEKFIELGLTSRGTPIRLRRDLLEATTVITMGAICHHYFAGYGGGRKLIFPGCGEKKSIYANHGLYLDKNHNILAPGCQPGNMLDNPLAEDLFEIEKMLPAQLCIHGILNSHGALCELLVTNGPENFLQACSHHGENCEISSKQFQSVIASCGGYPKDINFIQSHKAVHNAAMFVADGGLLLLYCECRDGLGSTTFLPWFDKGSFSKAFSQLAESYEGNGGTALAMMTKLQRIKIGLITEIDEHTCRKMGVEPWHHQQVKKYLNRLNPDVSVAIIPNASLLVNKEITG